MGGVIRVRFVAPDGSARDAFGAVGARLLDVAQAAGEPLEGACDGQLACATCHVLVDADDLPRLPAASGDEEELLDLVPQATRRSRLACQITLAPALDGLRVQAA